MYQFWPILISILFSVQMTTDLHWATICSFLGQLGEWNLIIPSPPKHFLETQKESQRHTSVRKHYIIQHASIRQCCQLMRKTLVLLHHQTSGCSGSRILWYPYIRAAIPETLEACCCCSFFQFHPPLPYSSDAKTCGEQTERRIS
jgi:hypothetical protein